MSDSNDRFENEPTRTSRDPKAVGSAFQDWLRQKTGDPAAQVTGLTTPQGSGMSSETLLLDVTWGDEPQPRQLVARLAPDGADIPVFSSYDLELQFRVMALVAEHTAVPVPNGRWLELDSAAIGSPFFVMDRESGRVPADIPPYVFEGWLLDAAAEEQQELEATTVGLLADLATIDVTAVDTAFLQLPGTGSPLRRHVDAQREYYAWVCDGQRSHPLVDDGFAWLEQNWPDESPTVVSWGDARIGNVMYEEHGFRPVAVFDWELAGLAPPEVDLGWMVFLHQFFQNIAEALEIPGLPRFMAADAVKRTYEERVGHAVGDLHWFQVYAGLRHAIIMSRITDRSVRFGEAEWPDDVDAAIPHRGLLESMLI